MNWLHYLLEANIYLGVFYIAYCLFLNKETHYVLNRVYLIGSCIIAFVLPVLQLGMLLPPPPPPMAPVDFTPIQITNVPATIIPVVEQHQFNWQDGLWYVYLAGAVIFLILFIVKLISLIKLIIGKPVLKHGDYNLIYINEANTAFSFFNYLFIGKNAPDKNIITRHELVHIRQMHSADIVFLEVLKIISWFNPLIYLIQGSLKTVHEYIADEQSVDSPTEALTYSSFLVNNAYGLTGPSITHSFFTYNLLKKRIIMLNQQRSGNLARLKYLVAVPIGAALLCASTLGFSKTYGWIDLAPQKPVNNQAQYREAPPTVMEEGPYTDFVRHMSNNIHFPASLKNSTKGVRLIASFELDDKGYIKNVSIDNKYHADISNNVINAIKEYHKPISKKFGSKHSMVIYFSTNSSLHRPPLDRKIEFEPGFLGEYLITDEGKLDIIKYPPPVVVPDNQVSTKRKTDVVKFPPPIVRQQLQPISERNYKAFAGLREFLAKNIQYPDAARKKKISGVTTVKFDLDDNGNIISSSIDADGNDFNEAVLAAFNAFTGKISAKNGSYYMHLAFRASKNDQLKFPPWTSSNSTLVGVVYIATEKSLLVDQVRFPPPVVKPDKSAKPKVDQIKFPPPIVKPDKSVDEDVVKLSPPPARQNENGVKLSPPPARQNENDVKLSPPPARQNENGVKLSPPKPKTDMVKFPPPIIYGDKNAVPVDFRKFLSKTIRYPTDARENGIVGNVVAEFKIDENNHIAGSRILQGIGHGCDEEVIRAITAYTSEIAAKNATYTISIRFNLAYDDINMHTFFKPVSDKIKSAPNYIGEMVVIGYGTTKK